MDRYLSRCAFQSSCLSEKNLSLYGYPQDILTGWACVWRRNGIIMVGALISNQMKRKMEISIDKITRHVSNRAPVFT